MNKTLFLLALIVIMISTVAVISKCDKSVKTNTVPMNSKIQDIKTNETESTIHSIIGSNPLYLVHHYAGQVFRINFDSDGTITDALFEVAVANNKGKPYQYFQLRSGDKGLFFYDDWSEISKEKADQFQLELSELLHVLEETPWEKIIPRFPEADYYSIQFGNVYDPYEPISPHQYAENKEYLIVSGDNIERVKDYTNMTINKRKIEFFIVASHITGENQARGKAVLNLLLDLPNK